MEKEEIIKVIAPMYKQIIAAIICAISFYVAWIGISQLISTITIGIAIFAFARLVTLNHRYRIVLNDDYEIYEDVVEVEHKIIGTVCGFDMPCFICAKGIKENDKVYVIYDGRDLLIVGKINEESSDYNRGE